MARLPERLSRTIRAFRERKLGLSLEALANNIGMDEKYLGELERGEKSCSIETLEAIAGGLHMPVWELVRAAEAAPEEPPSVEGAAPGDRQRRLRPAYPRGRGRKPLVPGDPKGITSEPTFGPSAVTAGLARLVVVVQETAAGYSAHVPDLPGCFASAGSADAVENEIRAAIARHLQQLRNFHEEPPDSRSYAIVIEIQIPLV
jgi:transcriptional regulator with XRE-family HTH domain/predicted RNase H-like HicB family nuclease